LYRRGYFARTCTVEMHVETLQEPLYTKFYWKNAAAQIVVQSKRMSKFHKNNFMRKLTGKMPQPSWIPQSGPTLVRACATEMDINISQESSAEPLGTEIYRKNAVAQIEPRTRTHILREPANSKRMPKFHQNNLTRKFAGKMPQTRVGTVIKLWHSLLP